MSEKAIMAGCHVNWRNDSWLAEDEDFVALQNQYGYGPFYVKEVFPLLPGGTEYASISTEDGVIPVMTVYLRLVETYATAAFVLDPAEIATD